MCLEEIFSERNHTANNGSLAKVLFYDIMRQLRASTAIASVNASNCFNWIAHAIASMIFQAFGVTPNAAKAMLESIQEMKFFLFRAWI